MKKLKAIWTLLKSKHYAVLEGGSEDEIAWAIESLRTADNSAKHSAIVIEGEPYQLASYGEKHSDGSRKATVRLVRKKL